MTTNGAENSTGQSAVFKIHVNTKIIFLVVIHFTTTLNVMAHKAHLRENNTFLKTEPQTSLPIANPVPIIQPR